MRWTGKAALLWLVCALTMAASTGDGPIVTARPASMKERAAAAKTIAGLIAGSMTDPPALAFANSISKSDSPSVAYATVYPLTMLLRIVTAQALTLWLCR